MSDHQQLALDVYDERALDIIDAEVDLAMSTHRLPMQREHQRIHTFAYTYMLRHPATFLRLLNEPGGPQKLSLRVRDHLRLKVAEIRAQERGYSTEDLQWYSPGVIRNLLPRALAPDGVDSPPDDGAGPRRGDPATGGNLTVMILDVRRAFESLNGWHSTYLRHRYGDGMSVDAIAATFNTTVDIVDKSIWESLEHMSRFLGGSRPRSCPRNCECREGDE